MKKFFLLKLFLLVNCACLANIDDYTPNFKAVIHDMRNGELFLCNKSDRHYRFRMTGRPLINYKVMLSTANVMLKKKNLIEDLKNIRALVEKFKVASLIKSKNSNNSIARVQEPQLSNSLENKETKEISAKNCIQISGSAENLNIGTMPAHAPQENSPQNQPFQEDSGSKNSSSAENVNISPMPVNEPKENLRQDNTAFLEKLKNGFREIFAPKELSAEDFEEILRSKRLSVEDFEEIPCSEELLVEGFEEIPRSEKLEEEFEEIHSDWSLKSIKGLVCTYTDRGDYKGFKPTINLENEIKTAFGGNDQAKELGFIFKNAGVCVDKNNNDRIAVQFTFAEKWNNIIALLAINTKKWEATLKNVHYFQDITGKQKLTNVVEVVESDPRFSKVCYTMNSGIQRVECSSNHSLTHCKFLIQCIADSQKSHKKPDLWSDGLVKFLSSYFSSSSNKPISSKEQFEKSCSDCARCNKKIDWFKPYINSKNSCTNKKRPCALFSLPDCNAIDYIVQSIALLKYCEDISSLRCNRDYVQKLARITPYKLKKLIPATVWKSDDGGCLECRKFFKQQIDKTYENLKTAVSALVDDFSVIFSLCNRDENISYPKSPQQMAQKIEDEYLKKYLENYGYQNHKAAKFYTLLGYDSHNAFIKASSKEVAQKIEAIKDNEKLNPDDKKSKFLREMNSQVRNSLSKQLLDAYLKYKTGNEKAFDNFILTKHQSDVIQEIFNKILDMKEHIGNQQAL